MPLSSRCSLRTYIRYLEVHSDGHRNTLTKRLILFLSLSQSVIAIVPVRDKRKVSVCWVIPSLREHFQRKSADFLGNLLGYEVSFFFFLSPPFWPSLLYRGNNTKISWWLAMAGVWQYSVVVETRRTRPVPGSWDHVLDTRLSNIYCQRVLD